MRVKAKRSFGGQYAMYENDVCDLPDNVVTRALNEEGYLEETAEEVLPEPEASRESEADQEPEDAVEVNLRGLRKEDLLRICEENGIKTDKKATKDELIAAIEGQE